MNTSNYNSIISTEHSSKTQKKTPSKTPLRLSSNKKTTPNSQLTNDRYIPNRTASNMEASFHLLCSRKDQENVDTQSTTNANNTSNTNNNLDNIKRKLINETCQGSMGDKTKVLNLHSKQPGQEQVFIAENQKIYGTSLTGTVVKKSVTRTIATVPEKILDAPDYLDDFCKSSLFVSSL